MPDVLITVHHPELGVESLVAEGALQHMPGWREGPLPGRGYDPGEHTVAEVREHLAGAEPAHAAEVLAAEREGRRRSGILSHTTTTAAADDAADEAGTDKDEER
jgi:hypothetical protein